MVTEVRDPQGNDIHDILQYLPHRYPFLLVDRVLECHPGERVVAIKNVTINEPFFNGHFPQRPVMPGVLIVEAMAQACGLLAFRTREAEPGGEQVDASKLFYLVGIDRARFKRPVEPGDQVRLEVTFNQNRRGIWMFEGEARVDDLIVASAEIRCTMRDV